MLTARLLWASPSRCSCLRAAASCAAQPSASCQHLLNNTCAAWHSAAAAAGKAAKRAVGTAATVAQNDTQPFLSLHATTKDVVAAKGKLRLDAFISAHVPDLSRTKARAAVDEGWVLLNGTRTRKPGATVKAGDVVVVQALPRPPPLQAVPEDIPLDVVYEDEYLMVINKAAGMVVHISVGHHSGTLVNALLHHCGLPGISLDQLPSGSSQDPPPSASPLANSSSNSSSSGASSSTQSQATSSGSSIVGDGEGEDEDEEEVLGQSFPLPLQRLPSSRRPGDEADQVLRPGIVHRLDKGTSGLLVVAKQELAHRLLCSQFKERSVGREYVSLALGCPPQLSGRVETNIDRDPNDRKRMAALAYGAARGRRAASNYMVQQSLAGGTASLMSWKLDTGRTHQIRVHARYLGHPLLGDDTYGGSAAAACSVLAKGRPSRQQAVRELVERLGRPALHARTLAFTHPVSGQRLSFEAEPPTDFQEALQAVRNLQ